MEISSFYRVSVKGIVVDEKSRILLTKEDNDKWELLGGGIGHGEEPVDTLKREVLEEAGLVVTWISSTPKYFITSPKSNGEGYYANIIYEIKLNNLDFIASDECTELMFFSVEEARNLDCFPNVYKLLDVFNPELHK